MTVMTEANLPAEVYDAVVAHGLTRADGAEEDLLIAATLATLDHRGRRAVWQWLAAIGLTADGAPRAHA